MLFDINNIPENTERLEVLSWEKIKTVKSEPLEPRSKDVLWETGWRMVKTCLVEDGIGLAAPQCGLFKRILICREMEGDADEKVFTSTFKLYINPEISPVLSEGKAKMAEACLSVPGKSYDIERHNKIEVSWDEPTDSGQYERKQRILEGWPARLFQHEFDHLNGISIPQRWDLQNKPKTNKKKRNKK